MKRFAVFCGESFYPVGGWRDFAGWFDTKEAAQAAQQGGQLDKVQDWYQIVDLTTGEIVDEKN